MKLAICFLFMISSTFANVDYIKIGKRIKFTRTQITERNNALACELREFEKNSSCEVIEKLNDNFSNLLSDYGYFEHTFEKCSYFSYGSIPEFKAETMDYLNALIQDADKDDSIRSLVSNLEKEINTHEAETRETISKLMLQEKYTNECLFKLPPKSVSLKELICK